MASLRALSASGLRHGHGSRWPAALRVPSCLRWVLGRWTTISRVEGDGPVGEAGLAGGSQARSTRASAASVWLSVKTRPLPKRGRPLPVGLPSMRSSIIGPRAGVVVASDLGVDVPEGEDRREPQLERPEAPGRPGEVRHAAEQRAVVVAAATAVGAGLPGVVAVVLVVGRRRVLDLAAVAVGAAEACCPDVDGADLPMPEAGRLLDARAHAGAHLRPGPRQVRDDGHRVVHQRPSMSMRIVS
jgi:hypothetical protein